MIALNRRTKVFFCKKNTDMRNCYDCLFERVKHILKKNPFSGPVWKMAIYLLSFYGDHRELAKQLLQELLPAN